VGTAAAARSHPRLARHVGERRPLTAGHALSAGGHGGDFSRRHPDGARSPAIARGAASRGRQRHGKSPRGVHQDSHHHEEGRRSVVHGLFDPARARTTGKTGTAWLSWHLDVEAPIRCQGAARRQGS
jgi:hypothetical protein